MRRLIACLLAVAPLLAYAKTPSQIFEAVSPSVVVVLALDAEGKTKSLGSGVVIGKEQVITNCHVVEKGISLRVKVGKNTHPATLKYSDSDRDLCQLVVSSLVAAPVSVGSVKNLKVGARVYALGAPQGLELTLSEGIVSALREADDGAIIQTTTPISPGSSGGGLFDEEGRLVGITTFYLGEGQALNFALPADWIATVSKRTKTASAGNEKEIYWLLKAIELEEKKNWTGLRDHCLAWLKRIPKSALALVALGEAYSNLGQNEQAIKAYRKGLLIEPGDADAWFGLGYAYSSLDQNDQAIKAYREALRIRPEYAEVWVSLGNVYGEVGQINQSIRASQEALRLQPENAAAWFNLGNAYAIKGDRMKVTEVYQKLRTLDPERAEKFFNNFVMP